MHGSSPGAQTPLARSSLGKPAGSAWLRGLLAEIVVPPAWQNRACLVEPHQGHVCQQWCCAFVGTASIFRCRWSFYRASSCLGGVCPVHLPVPGAVLPEPCLLSPDSRLVRAA